MELEEYKLSDESNIQCKYYFGESPEHTIAVVKFSGHYRMGHEGNPDSTFMGAMTAAGLFAMDPDGLVIDMSELKYDWGDMLDAVLPNEAGRYGELRIPTVVVVGPESKDAVRSLIDDLGLAKRKSEVEWLVESLPEALDQVVRRVEADAEHIVSYVYKTLEELDGEDWGEPEYDSYLVATCHRLRRVPLNDYKVEDLRIMIGQQFGLEYILPLALNVLEDDPLAEGDFYPGDLLNSVLNINPTFWDQHPELRQRMATIAVAAEANVQEIDEVDEDLKRNIALFRTYHKPLRNSEHQ